MWISGQSLKRENCHNSRTSNDIDIRLGPVTKLDKKNTATSKKIDNDVMPANWDVVPDAWFVKLTLSLTIAFYLTKIEV